MDRYCGMCKKKIDSKEMYAEVEEHGVYCLTCFNEEFTDTINAET